MSDFLDQLGEKLKFLSYFENEIRDALRTSGDLHTFDQLVGLVFIGHYNLLIHKVNNSYAVFFTELLTFPNKVMLNVFLAAGDLEAVIDAQKAMLVREAREAGATVLSFTGRKGWARELKNEGWDHEYVTMTKEV